MSDRACWTSVDSVDIAISSDWHDQYGSTVDEVAIVLLQDQDGLVIEGADIDDLRAFVGRVTEALDAYDRAFADKAYDEWLARKPDGVEPKGVIRD